MEMTGASVAVFLVLLFAPGLSSVLKSIAFRIRAAGKAELERARREAGGGRRATRRGRHG
ncbi:hypothetical protein SHJG_p209 (plasmid) [Streptomyces hygroscopicus subsp. jinggangensis 5008]|nr:hypothetical protein SHJG_p209 [Streptomyces hygroscopicus subsp. jinggangensis 5008]AGF68478.1 hypothetical protein SHJGH_p209 [Streptomyces hygroscopicus subsp. jinggangensis TL01]